MKVSGMNLENLDTVYNLGIYVRETRDLLVVPEFFFNERLRRDFIGAREDEVVPIERNSNMFHD